MKTPRLDYRLPAIIGLIGLVVLVGGSVVGASLARISGAVIAFGAVGVEGKLKSIQHLDGGIVKEIYVSPKDRVKKNQVLILLDDTTIAANLAIYESRLKAAIVRKERLVGELNGKYAFTSPVKIAKALKLGDLADVVAQQMTLLKARRLNRESRLTQLSERIEQYKKQMIGIKGLRKEKENQIEAYLKEYGSTATLVKKGLAIKRRLLALDRALADLRGQIAEHDSEIARLRHSIAETRGAKIQVDREFRERAIAELEKTDNQIDELRQQLLATRLQLSRMAIRAPVAGVIHELNVFTIGGVVRPGQILMQIVPQTGDYEFELKVAPQAIDNVYIGQPAIVRFPAFDQQTTPELAGTVRGISPSSIVDEKTGQAFFHVTIKLPEKEIQRLGDKVLIPGMPVEAMMQTTERTILSYFLKPLRDQLGRALRED